MEFQNPLHKLIHQICESSAKSQGLDFFGMASLNVDQDFTRFKSWLDESRHGSMEWLKNHLEIREKPERLLPGAKIALIFGFPYFLGPKFGRVSSSPFPEIAQYARLKDYHKFMRQKLVAVQHELNKYLQESNSYRITVDSAPLLERALASHTSQCFIGKNTCMIHPTKGSYFLLGEILTTLSLGTDSQNEIQVIQHTQTIDPTTRLPSGGCGSCRRCQVHCPTGALDQDYKIDARKCLSYWTIEHRGVIPLDYWPWVGRFMFGCDICQNVCPYNRGVLPQLEAKRLEQHTSTPDLLEMVLMDQAFYEKKFGGTPMTRAKRSGLRRNALIAGVVLKDKRILSLLHDLANDEDTAVKETSVQAKSYLEKTK